MKNAYPRPGDLTACIRGMAVLLLGAGLVAAGCDSKTPGKSGPRELKMGYVMAPVGAAHEAAQEFAKLVERKTGGRITVKLYPSAALGKDRELTEGLRLGSVDVCLSGLASISSYVPQYEVLEAPYLFRDFDHLDKVVNGPIGKEVADALAKKKGIRILAWWPRGPRYLTANKPIRTPADLEGVKLRVPELPTYIEVWRILGANPTPITYSEMFMALKQGVVDGQEHPLEDIYTASLYEVQKYIMETRHLIATFMVMVSDRLLSQLTPEQQAAIKQAAVEAGKYDLELVEKYDDDYRAKLKEKGVQFVEVDIEAFRRPVIEKLPARFKDHWAPGLFERIQKIK